MRRRGTRRSALALALLGLGAAALGADGPGPTPMPGDGWVELIGRTGPGDWRGSTARWEVVGDARLDPGDPARLAFTPGAGAVANGRSGRAPNLLSTRAFGDCEAHLEFNVPKGSNSGVKFAGLYEVQIFDSFGAEKLDASHTSGGIYPRADLLPKYHYLDDGFPPSANAGGKPGDWQTLDVSFRAPRFDGSGRKTADARFLKVVLNGRTVQEGRDVPTPTGHAWRTKEVPEGPLLLQGDHGPVAFRNVRVRPLP